MNVRKISCLLLCLSLLSSVVCAAGICGQDVAEALVADWEMEPGESVSDWTAFVASANGYTDSADEYLQGLWDYVSEQYQTRGGLDTVKATVWHRISLTVLGLGADPTCFGVDGDGNTVDLISEGTYHWDRTESLGTQGANAWIYGLLVLDSMNYEIPEGAAYTRERMIDGILAYQTENGGFHIGSGVADVDVTGMALQALAPYYGKDAAVTESVDRAVGWLSSVQNAQGDFGSGGCESCAQVILGLCALGIDPSSDPRFCKDGGSALSGLLLYRGSDGFSHLLGGSADSLSSAQAGLALTAFDLLQAGQGRLFDFTDESITAFVPGKRVPLWIPAGAAVLISGIAVCIWKGKKKCTK